MKAGTIALAALTLFAAVDSKGNESQAPSLAKGSFPGSILVPGTGTSIKLGGFINVTYNQDLGPALDRKNMESFSIPAIPVTSPARDREGQAFFDARFSRLNFETRTPAAGSEVKTLIEFDFWMYNNQGSDAQLNSSGGRFRHAYLQWGGWLAGQTWTNFIDLDALPDTIDWGGPSGALTVRQPQLRYRKEIAKGHALSVAAEHARTDITYADNRSFSGNDYFSNRRARDRRPDLTAKYKWTGGSGHLSLSALWRELRWEDPNDQSEHDYQAYGASLGATFKPGSGGSYLFAQTSGGSGIGRYMGELYNEGDAGTYDPATDRFTPTKVWGVSLGGTFYWSERWRSTLAFGRTRITDHPSQANSYDGIPDRQYSTAHLNLMWSPFDGMDLGGEYIWGLRETATGMKGNGSRITLGARYSF